MSAFHVHSSVPTTKGNVIRWANFYQFFFHKFLSGSEETIVELAQIKPGDGVLDVGCGTGSLTISAKKRAGYASQVYGLDASPEMIEVSQRNAQKAKVKVNFQVGVAEALPFDTASFDVVVSRLVMHHLPGELKQQALHEIYRVLKPGGYCLIVDFEPPALTLPFHAKPHSHEKTEAVKEGMLHTDVEQFIPLFEQSGFVQIKSGPTGHRLLSFVGARKE